MKSEPISAYHIVQKVETIRKSVQPIVTYMLHADVKFKNDTLTRKRAHGVEPPLAERMSNNKVGFELAVRINEDSTQALLQFCHTPIVWTEVYPAAVVVIRMQIIPDDWLSL